MTHVTSNMRDKWIIQNLKNPILKNYFWFDHRIPTESLPSSENRILTLSIKVWIYSGVFNYKTDALLFVSIGTVSVQGLSALLRVKVFRCDLFWVSASSMDINLILNHFWANDLFEGIIMVYNYLLKDFKSPLEKLIQKIENDQKIGDTLLMYLSCTLG